MGSAFVMILIWKMMQIKANGIVFSMLVNSAFALGSHYLLNQPGGWIKTSNKLFNEIKLERKQKRIDFFNKLKEFNVVSFYKNNFPTNEFTYVGFGIYIIIYTMTTMYSTHVDLTIGHGQIVLFIYESAIAIGVLMALYPIWPLKLKKKIVLQVTFPIVLISLIFFSYFFVVFDNFDSLQLSLFTLNLVLVIIIVGWKLALPIIIIGFYSSVHFYKYYTGTVVFDMGLGSPQFIIMYIMSVLSAVTLLFLKPTRTTRGIGYKNLHLKNRCNSFKS